jgi:carboxymethylenebutenolidase
MSADVDANERTWDAHTAAEFVTLDVDATMATMTDDPVVLHVPTSIGARGRDAVRRFYAEHFIGHQAADMTLRVLSRTATADRVVDEIIISFTHDVEIPWVLPGVAPTGARVTVPIVTVIGMRDGLVDSEHIYWDQACVLAQVGLLDPGGLPVTGADQIRPLARQPPADSFCALLLRD